MKNNKTQETYPETFYISIGIYNKIRSWVFDLAKTEETQAAFRQNNHLNTTKILMKNVEKVLQFLLLIEKKKCTYYEKETVKLLTSYTDIFKEYDLSVSWENLFNSQGEFIGSGKSDVIATLEKRLSEDKVFENFGLMVVCAINAFGIDASNSLKLMILHLAFLFADIDGDADYSGLISVNNYIENTIWKKVTYEYEKVNKKSTENIIED